MNSRKERRQCPREDLPTPEVGIVYPEYKKKEDESTIGDEPDTLLVNVLNRSEDGLLLESCLELKVDSSLDIQIHLPHEELWQAFRGQVKWVHKNPDRKDHYLLGIKSQPATIRLEGPRDKGAAKKKRMVLSDLGFLIQIPLFDCISEEAKCPLLNSLTPKHLQVGERLILQGDEGDTFYIIQHGSCVVNLEKEGTIHPIARRREGDIVGEMAILTGERRRAHVDAETDMKVWSISRGQFDGLCEGYPDLRNFLTELITRRFSAEKMTADRTVGKYVIHEIIGRGGYSVVYRGIHESLNMPVAIKMLNHDMAMEPDFSEKFQNEAKIIARLNHENIIKVYDIEDLYRTIFIIMEYLDGEPLDHSLEKMRRLPLSRVLDVLLQVGAGLAYAHEHGIVHQDIKPGNIFIQPDNRAIIVDFGLAVSPGTVDDLCWPGSVFYASPEQIEGEPVDERSDIYSLGITAFEMITGQRPFPGDNAAKAMQYHVNEDVPDPRTLIPDLPDELSNFVIHATRRDPAARYESVSQILHDLKPLAEKMGLESQSHLREPGKMMSLFVFYHDHNQLALKRLVEDFNNELKQVGATLRAADFKDVQ
jgi:serine/threonine protein kinase